MACEWGIFTGMDNPTTILITLDMVGHEETWETVAEMLRCTDCGLYPIFPMSSWSMCRLQHLYCQPCLTSNPNNRYGKRCEVELGNRICGHKIKTFSRPEMFTTAFNISYFECGYGCGAIPKGLELGDHLLQKCPYRFESACLVTGCFSTAKYKGHDFWNHLVKGHPQAVVRSNNRLVDFWFAKKGGLVAGQDAIKKLAQYFIPPKLKDSACSVHVLISAFGEHFAIFCEEFPDRFEFFGLVLNRKEVAEQFRFFVKMMQFADRKVPHPPLVGNMFQCETGLLSELKGYRKGNMVIKVDKGLILEDIAGPDELSLFCRTVVSIWVERK